MQNIKWSKSQDGRWFNLSQLDLTHIHCTGVYIIWHGGSSPRIVRVGHGNIAGRLTAHRLNLQIMRYSDLGPLMVTWCSIADPYRRHGIANYLSREFQPIIKDKLPSVPPIAARSPFV